jgi:hypothetical protein
VVRSLFPGNGILGAETTASKRSVTFNRSSAETNARTKTRQFGAICTTPGNLCLRKTAWWGWEDSNLQPNDYQPPALSIEHSGSRALTAVSDRAFS